MHVEAYNAMVTNPQPRCWRWLTTSITTWPSLQAIHRFNSDEKYMLLSGKCHQQRSPELQTTYLCCFFPSHGPSFDSFSVAARIRWTDHSPFFPSLLVGFASEPHAPEQRPYRCSACLIIRPRCFLPRGRCSLDLIKALSVEQTDDDPGSGCAFQGEIRLGPPKYHTMVSP